MSDEEIIIKFFTHINYLPEKKDYFIRDFEEFYFKIRPKFSSKLIKVLLEVISNLFYQLVVGRYRIWCCRPIKSDE
jgi:hypothetical protein